MQHTKLVQLTMCMGIFLCMLDTTIMNIALPAIQTGLGVPLNQISWALNIYTILFAVFTIPLSRLAEIKGKHKVYLLGLLAFLIGSILSGLAPNLPILIAGRAVQSIGAAILFPVSMTIGIASTAIDKRKHIIAALGITQGLAAALGPVIGGLITQLLNWRWVFFINIPILLLACIFCLTSFNFKNETVLSVKIDWSGTACLMLALFSLVLALLNLSTWGIYSPKVIGLLLIFISATSLFLWIESKVAYPIIHLDLFKNRAFNGAAITTILSNFFMTGVSVLLPTFFSRIQGMTELTAALLLTPLAMMIFIFSPLSAIILDKVGPRWLILVGFTLMSAGYFSLFHFNASHLSQVIITCLLIGSGYGIIVGPIVVLSAADFTGELLTASQSVSGVLRQIGITLAIALFVTGLTANLTHENNLIKHDIKQAISSSNLSADKQKQTLINITNGISTQQTNKQIPRQHVSTQERQELITQQTALALKSFPLSEDNAQLNTQIKANVTEKVDKAIKETNQTINVLITKSKGLAKNGYSKAFSDIYSAAFPILILSSFSFLLFKKKDKANKIGK